MNHCFISTDKNNIIEAMEYYTSDFANKKKFFNSMCFLPDSLVLKHKMLFVDIEVFIQGFNLKGNMLDYYGKTIIPVETIKIIKTRFESDFVLMLKATVCKDLKTFYKLLQYAIENKHYIVHLGI